MASADYSRSQNAIIVNPHRRRAPMHLSARSVRRFMRQASHPTLSSAGNAESPLWHSETAVGNTVPFPAPPSKGAMPMPESYRERLSAVLCVKRLHSLWLSSTSLHPNGYNIPPEARHNFVQYIPPQWLAICRRVW